MNLHGRHVYVHLNLKTGKLVIAEKKKGTILAYADAVTLENVTFDISEKQRQYCVDKSGRWVHAYAVGTLVGLDPVDVTGMTQITYNPFRAPTFHVVGREQPVHSAEQVHFTGRYGYLREAPC